VSSNPWSRKAKKPSLKGLAKTNGKALANPPKGKPSLRKLVVNPVEEERPYQAPKPKVKEDFRVNGVLFSGAEVTGSALAGYRDGMFRPYGTVDVTNGDQTYTLHNRYGSWMHDVWNGNGAAAEPARVAAWLGILMSQAEMGQKLTQRFEAELKKQGIPTLHQQRVRLENDAAAQRKRTRNPEPTEVTKKNPWSRNVK
jgi:hypothetical protein